MEITLDELVRETAWLRRLARSLVAENADDLAQDAYVIAHTQRPADGRPLRPWLVRVARNLARMRRRGEDRARARELAVAELAPQPATPAELVARVETHRMLAGLVLELPAALRDVLLLHYVEGLTSPEIGNRLGLAAGTVRWRLKQAVDELRARLDERQPNRAWVPVLAALSPRRVAVAGLGVAAVVALIIVVVLAAIGTALALHHPPAAPAQLPSSPAAARASVRSVAAPALAEPIEWRITGTVIDEQGVPAARAEVTIGLDCKFPIDSVHARTDELGRFSVEVPPRCRYWMLAEKGDAVARQAALALPGSAVELVLGHDAPSVRVVDAETGAPIAGAQLDIGDYGPFLTHAEPARTGPDGTVPPRELVHACHAMVEMPGYVSQEVELPWPWTQAVTIALRRGHTISGRLVDRSGAPVSRWLVMALHPDDRAYGATTDAAGSFVLAVPDLGAYRLGTPCDNTIDVTVPGPPITLVREHDCGRGRPVTTDVAIAVVDDRGPVAGAEVRSMTDVFRPGHTDANGRFVIAAATIAHTTMIEVVAQLGDRASSPVSIELAGTYVERTIRLVDTAIAGVVIDGGRPVQNAWVKLAGGPIAGITQTTGPDGSFTFNVPAGSYRIAAGRDPEIDVEDARTVESGSHDLTLELP